MVARAETEQPGAAWRLLDPRSTPAVAVPLVALALLGWYLTVRQARDMSGMITGLGQVGTHMPNTMGSLAFMGMWLGMMAAMMLPAIGPVVLAQQMVVRSRGEGALPSVAFVASYLAVWLLIGLAPLLAFLAFRNLPMEAQSSPGLRIVGGAALFAAGVYQFTALMVVLLVVGLMNLIWMAAIALVFLAEKNWRHGVLVTRLTGGGVAALGVVAAAAPSILSAISRT